MTTHTSDSAPGQFDVDAPGVTRFDLVREGARRDGVEIAHYAPRFPVPGTRAERRVERVITLLFLLTGLASLAFLVVYIWWPWEYEIGAGRDKYFTPLLGLTLGLALFGVGMAAITWGKKLLPEEVSIQERHNGPSPADEQAMTGATMLNMVDELGIKRRPMMLKLAIALGLLPIGAAAAAPLIGGLIKDPHGKGGKGQDDLYFSTGWNPVNNDGKPIRLTREDGSPIRPSDVSVGGQITVFPGIPEGATNKYADSPTLLIHLREDDAAMAKDRAKKVNEGSQWQNYVAYSKICTHAGCPASLYEQQTNRLLCPCHQSQFQITDNARPIFGPATRALPQLPINVDDEGYFVATSDYKVPVGPAFWERP